MSISDGLIQELTMESSRTRALLERLPEDKLEWRPHDKSMPLGRLATHIAELPSWGKLTLEQDLLDMGEGFTPTVYDSVAEILDARDQSVAELGKVLSATPDEEYRKTWTMKFNGQDVFSAPKSSVVRDFVLSHVVHHRGQLTVFLRLLDVPLPMTLGPSADETGGF
jgi:uncharacterized damage-inducible protein DinB